MNHFGEKVTFIWSVADLLRGLTGQTSTKDVMLPMTVLRRLDCVLEPTKEKVLEQLRKYEGKIKNIEPIPNRVAGQSFHNTSPFTFEKLRNRYFYKYTPPRPLEEIEAEIAGLLTEVAG